MLYVVGSGPAGVACATALLRSGHAVTMLDAGRELEPERKALVDGLAATSPEHWHEGVVSKLKERMRADSSGVPLKYVYGSDFPYRDTQQHIPLIAEDAGIVPSFARGGLSNVWGATLLPYTEKEFETWPLRLQSVEPYYRKVLTDVPMAAVQDDIAALLPLYSTQSHALAPSRQASNFLADLQDSRTALSAADILFGRSRLAVWGDGESNTCAFCGLCMYGCPYRLIYNSGDRVMGLTKAPRFRYHSGVVVTGLNECDGGVRIHITNLQTGMTDILTGDRVFIAGGTLPTTKLLLDLLGAYDVPVPVKDSQYFLFPLVRYQNTCRVETERLHTLSQVFIELLASRKLPHRVHLQVYTYNDLFEKAVQETLSFLQYPLRPITRRLLGRLLVVQGYLHSNLSAPMSVRLSATGQLTLDTEPSRLTKEAVAAVARTLFRQRRALKAVPLLPFVKIAKPGRGFHTGGTFPMASRPGDFETDTLGRPKGFRRIHAVDATVFPNVPSGPITLTVMANAYRIAEQHDSVS